MVATFNLPTSITCLVVPKTIHFSNHRITSSRLRLRSNRRSYTSRNQSDGSALCNATKIIHRIIDAISSYFFYVSLDSIQYFRKMIRVTSLGIRDDSRHDTTTIAVKSQMKLDPSTSVLCLPFTRFPLPFPCHLKTCAVYQKMNRCVCLLDL